ncbi:MAG: SDR family NAD(P)-dependent oxidoreductase [Gammaproteobacteria bacterium]|nr:SDR family NAD(P)-dependent oxidoreductase [Gammaproteobacteria bacterium]
MLHQNSSDFASQRYSSTFTGQEFFLADHVVQEQRVLPGVVFLEIARAAGALAAGQPVIRLRNVVWARPIIVGEQPIHVHIELFPEEDEQGADGEIAFEIYTEPTPQPAQDADVEPVVHSQGRIGLSVLAEAPELDLPGLQARCSQNLLSPSQIYEAFQTIGIDYGPAHQGIEEIHVGAGQILAKLSLPASVSGTHDQFVLHPSLMDSALQALVGFMLGTKDLKPALPFALQEVKIYSGCRPAMWVWLRYAEGSASGDKVQKFDLDLCAESGLVCVQIKSVSLRELESDAGQKGEMETLLLQPDWKEQPVSVDAAPPDYAQHLVILCEPGDMSQEFLERHIEGVRILHLSAEQTGIEERFETCALKVFEEIQRILTTKPRNKILIQLVVVMEGEHQLFCALSGLLKTAQLENPTLIGQQIGVEKWENAPGLLEKLRENSRTPGDTEIRYQDGQRYVAGWKEVEVSQEDVSLPWKDQGIYLITGGAGGLGQIFAKEIAQQVNEATLILTGRSALNANRQAQLQELQASGARVVYEQVDVTDQQAVDSLIQHISKEFGGLNGIIHSAGVLRDNFILKKSREELYDVLPPKVAGTIYLDHASKESDLDFFVLFSSVAGGLGNPGQADYATANAFLDAYAGYRNALVASGQRRGHTLSINWPLWKEGGMHIDEATEKMLLQNTGVIAMQTHAGMRAFYHSIASGQGQVMVLEGDLQRIRQTLFAATAISAASKTENVPAASDSAIESERLREQVKETLIRGISELLHVNPEDIDDEAELAEYGCDPITLSELTVRLNQEYALDVASTVFFEHPTLRGVAAYLAAEYPAVLGQQFQTQVSKPPSAIEETRIVPTPIPSETEGLRLDSVEGVADDVLWKKATPYFTKLLSTVMKLPVHRIDADAPMEQYGIDSIMVMDLTAHLEQIFGSLPKTLFFEYQTIRELTGYFLESYREKLTELLGIQAHHPEAASQQAGVAAAVAKPSPAVASSRRRSRFVSVSEPRERKTTGASDIAVIGLSGRYPQARTIQEFWRNLCAGKDCITEIPPERWDHSAYFDEDKNAPGKTYGKWGGFLNDMDRFDPLFFNISPREAELMDPQERLFLECAYETLEDAGYTRTALGTRQGGKLEGDVGVFVGVMFEEYQLYGAQSTILGRPLALPGNSSSIANRVSYWCNFHGPSLALNTMCSSSLTTIHLACQSLQYGDCKVAIAGGVNLSLHPNKYLLLGHGKFLASKGRCESFGQGGDGYVPGEGVGAVLLKPLARAIADGDHIYGVIKATAVNHGGKTNGYTVPNPNAQFSVISRALEVAGIDARTISYLEAHGTGTSLGDPIEMTGLTKAFRKYTQDAQFCAIGSAKSNIGHCESAAGISGVTKVLLQLTHRQLVPSLHSKVLNPNIDFSATPFVVQQELTEWPRPVIDGREVPRRAGISSFGAGGSNGHVIIEEYRPEDRERPRIEVTARKPALIALSARNAEQLREQVQRLLTALRERQYADSDLADLAYTLQVGREAMEHRLAVSVRSVKELEEKLTQFADGREGIEDLYLGQVKDNKEMLAVFAADEDLVLTLEAWIAKGKYAKLADLWAKGLSFDWNALYGDGKPQRVSLPTYPFAKTRYWAANIEPIEPIEAVEKAVKETPATMYYHGIWEKSEAGVINQTISGHLLLFDTSENMYSTMQERLKVPTILVQPGDQYTRVTDAHYIINPEAPNDYKRLIEELQQGAGIPDKIIHLWSQNQFGRLEEKLTDYLSRGLYSIYYLTQALMEQRKTNVHLLYLYEEPEKTVQPHHGGLSGLFRTIKRENPNYIYQTIAVPDLKNIFDIIVAEFQNVDSPEIRYENSTRYIKKWELREEIAIEEQIALRENGVYLITGGAGGLGLIFAEYIASQVKARLVLTGRSELNQEKLARIDEIKSRGCEVIYMRSDVSNRDDVKKLIAEVTARYHDIHGIIHSAGVIRDAYLPKKTREEIGEVIATKVYGTVYLDEETRTQPLDFFALFSSVAGVFGNPGQSDYAYANRFQDYYAEKRTAEGRSGKTISISWPLWKEGGMRIPKEQEEHFTAKTGIVPMPTELGTAAWRQATFGSNFFHCIVVYGYQHKVEQSIRDLYEEQRVELVESHDEQGLEPDERENASIRVKLEGDIKKIASDILKLPLTEIDIKENLGLYGFDSVSYGEYAQKISDTYTIEMDPIIFYENSTIHDLIGYIHKEFETEINTYYPSTETKPCDSKPQPLSHAKTESSVREAVAPKLFAPSEPKAVVSQESVHDDIAIIGVHGIFPGSRDLKEFWRNLESETDLITEVPKERWDWRKYYGDPAKEKNTTNSKWGGFIPDVDKFDPAFFNISPDEAEMMDPQQRLFMEVVWKAIEDAGYKSSELWGKSVGVFVGAQFTDYGQLISTHGQAANKYMATGNAHTMIANRISFLLNLRGPSEAIDTACSSALIAIHEAVNSVRSGESELAIAGGVSLMLLPEMNVKISQMGILSSDGRCKTFDKSANGYVRGEGLGALLLKPLSKAIADHDNIQAVIKGTSANHGGRASSLVSPNSEAQTALLIKAYEEANIAPETVTFIETHGTGTALGDPVEIEGIKKAFKALEQRQGRKITQTNYCGLGAVKTNIGHLEPAAGIAGMVKAILAMKHKKLPGTLHLKKMNPYIRLKKTPFYIVEKTQAWERLRDEAGNSIPRRAGVSSFGFGGTNAHIVIEEYDYPALPAETGSEEDHIILLSAKNAERLKEYAKELVDWLTDGTITATLQDIAYTLQRGRDAMDERLAVVVASRAALRETLTRYVEGKTGIKNLYQGNVKEQGDKYALLVDGEAGETLIRSYIYKKESAKLARLWVSAVEIDWALLYEKQHPRRISLPTYPFARERHWIKIAEKEVFKGKDEPSETGGLERQEKGALLPETELTSLSEEQRRESSKRLSTGIGVTKDSKRKAEHSETEPAGLLPEARLTSLSEEQRRESSIKLSTGIGRVTKDSEKRDDHAEMEPTGLLRAEVFTSLSEEQRRESSKKLAGSAMAKASDNRRKK